MSNGKTWSVVSTSESNRIILAIDFPAAGRNEASFDDLTKKMGSAWAGYGVLQTVPPTVRITDRPSGDFYTEHWMQGVEWEKYEVVVVMGYCVGSVYAAEIAQRLTRWQAREPEILLFDPQLTDSQLLAAEMHKMIGMAGAVFTADEADQARQRATRIVESPSAALYDAASEIVELYREMATIAFQRIGLNDNLRDDVVRLFESYMTWLAAAAQVDPSEGWKRSTAITSADYAVMENRGDTTVLNAVKTIGRRFPLDVGHAELMRSAQAVEVLQRHADFLAS
ncbi:hypothetical protein [Krasilnikovia sp. MM14-A1259]|uniref:hypothetical protein n=1 Tax=Krasilnikovia sp. MM14-A1259 TaxID=3373539 RepID=UPI003824E4C1